MKCSISSYLLGCVSCVSICRCRLLLWNIYIIKTCSKYVYVCIYNVCMWTLYSQAANAVLISAKHIFLFLASCCFTYCYIRMFILKKCITVLVGKGESERSRKRSAMQRVVSRQSNHKPSRENIVYKMGERKMMMMTRLQHRRRRRWWSHADITESEYWWCKHSMLNIWVNELRRIEEKR